MTDQTPAAFEPFFGSVTEAQVEAGRAQMADAASEYLVRKSGEVHELLITHNFVIGWFVREVLAAPEWRWMTLNQAHCGLTVIGQKQGRPWTLLSHNDLGASARRASHRAARGLSGLGRGECLRVPARRVRIVVVRVDHHEPRRLVQPARRFEGVVGVQDQLGRAESACPPFQILHQQGRPSRARASAASGTGA